MEAPRAAKPAKGIFDPFNSGASGHQRAENRLSGSTGWRDSRNLKLHNQFSSGAGSGKRLHDTVGAGNLINERQQKTDVLDGLVKIDKDVERRSKRVKTESNTTKKAANLAPVDSSPSHLLSPISSTENSTCPSPTVTAKSKDVATDSEARPQLFAGLTVYINGSTAPAISDHKLKRILSNYGARLSIALGRRTVTHVIIGRPSSSGGSGGGLSASKIQKEITTLGGNKIKFVSAEWVLESVKARKRLPEIRFEALRLAPKGVGSVAHMFGAASPVTRAVADKDGNG